MWETCDNLYNFFGKCPPKIQLSKAALHRNSLKRILYFVLYIIISKRNCQLTELNSTQNAYVKRLTNQMRFYYVICACNI